MVVHAYYPLGEPRVQREAGAARDAGFEVTVLCLRADGEPARQQIDGIHVRRAPVRHRRGAGLARMLVEYLTFCGLACLWLAARSARRPFDIVHFHNPPDFLTVAGLVPRARGSKLVLDVHDLSSHLFGVRVGGRVGWLATRILVWIERLACAGVDGVVTVHEPYRRELVEHGVRADKVCVVMNSVDDAVLGRAHAVEPLLERAARFRIAYHGTLTSLYGVDLMIAAIAQLRAEGLDLEAVILGGGDEVPSLQERLAQARLDDRVHLPGRYVPIETALATVATADCGVIPNRPSEINRFALSSKLFEYVALGIPVVVSRLETLAGHFDSDEVTFFDPGNAASLAEALRWVHDYPEEAHAKADRAQARAQRYSWSRGRAELQRLYEGLLEPARN
jgi:glycosyltransferase involved in cell wall biosynthesis